ncbi:putative zinc finger protein At1g68190 isoform X1 [Daucus carota subsp. sativus]|uniref:putative zinc finger protein At1g68190 isoform X1 n=1 Tax=Daucus carota subsp. sativus TaxID=79200 RepID=UPI0007EFBE86|nr:PREDICTED: putative zinc finger protein At1g68190 isoform X1 [Daucus carota subsp. sativus]
MDKVCEYCKVLRPIVYCKADSANLCLQCDAKIHSANALSNKHSRTLLCESCRSHWAYIQCSNHQMFMCRRCDRSKHNVSSQHQRRVVSSYLGCPSAMDLAALWGFDLGAYAFNYSGNQDQFPSTSRPSVDTGTVSCHALLQSPSQPVGSPGLSKVEYLTSRSSTEQKAGLKSKHSKAFLKGKQEESTCLILQQILDLKRLQCSDGSNCSSFILCQEKPDVSSPEDSENWKLHNKLNQQFQDSPGLDSELQQIGSPEDDLDVDSFPLSFSQLDHLTSSSIGETTLQGDAIWQCKSPNQSGQLWSINMQDLGVCEELGYFDEQSMPDIDLTFRNFEELFGGGEQEPTKALGNDLSQRCTTLEKDISSDNQEHEYASGMEESRQLKASEMVRTGYKEKKKIRRF